MYDVIMFIGQMASLLAIIWVSNVITRDLEE